MQGMLLNLIGAKPNQVFQAFADMQGKLLITESCWRQTKPSLRFFLHER